MKRMSDESKFGWGCIFPTIVIALSSIPAWVTHVIHCFKNDEWGFLIAGAIAAPIGVVHGWLIWFGVA